MNLEGDKYKWKTKKMLSRLEGEIIINMKKIRNVNFLMDSLSKKRN